jgi:hypothetical protein
MPGPGTWSAGDILTAQDLNAIGVWESYSPVVTQSGTRSATVNYAKYVQINKMCLVNVDLTMTTSGSSGSKVTVSLPLNASSNTTLRSYGTGLLLSGGSDVILLNVFYDSVSTVRFASETSTSKNGLGVSPSIGLLNDDVISFSAMYEIA